MSRYMLVCLVVVAAAACRGRAGDPGAEGARGPAGMATLVRLAEEVPGGNCPLGGTRVQVGRDANGNGELDEAEVETTRFVCDGSDGRSLVMTSGAALDCPTGGVVLSWGIDANGDGTLDPTERSGSTSICNGGERGAMQVMTPVAPGEACVAGGYVFTTGRDTNDNGVLDEDEVESTATLCNGVDGRNSLVRQTMLKAGSAECPNGGIRFDSGVDLDRNGLLDDEEVSSTNALCRPCEHLGSRNCTSGTLRAVHEIPLSFRPGNLDVGDLNGDGVVDIVFKAYDARQHFAALGVGDGRFGTPFEIHSGRGGAFRLTDIDGDGNVDLVGCTGWLLPGAGDGTFGDEIEIPGLAQCIALEVVDFDGDGRLDLAMMDNSQVVLWKQGGDRVFTEVFRTGRTTWLGALAAGDVDGDGHMDLVWVGNNDSPEPGSLEIAWNDGLGSVRDVTRLETIMGAGVVALGDLDGDGILDIAIGAPAAPMVDYQIETRLGVAGGLPEDPVTAATFDFPAEPMSVALADVDGDGSLDLIASENGGETSIYLGKGDGTFAPRRAAANTGGRDFLRAADFNDDGKIDFAVSGFNAYKIAVLLGD